MDKHATHLPSKTRPLPDFEVLLLEISAHFINLPAERIDGAIEDAQGRICQSLGLDMSCLWQWSETEAHMMRLTHLYSPPGGPRRPSEINGVKAFPWTYERMLAGETLAIVSDQLPEEAALDRQTRQLYGVRSSVVIPLMIGGKPIIGVLSFDRLHEDRAWQEIEVSRLQLVAEIFSNALARKETERLLSESEARLSLAAESAEAGLWEYDSDSRIFWATDKAREIFGYAPDEHIDLDRFEQSVHPDDLESVRQVLRQAMHEGVKVEAEYRILVDPDHPNRVKWVYSRGCPYFDAANRSVLIRGVSIDVSRRKAMEFDLEKRLAEVEQLKHRLEKENVYLKEELEFEHGGEIIGQSESFENTLSSARKVASTGATVLLLGETGTGKGVIARSIHKMSDRSDHPFVTVNCAALPHYLIESELFGHEKGAFTGAHTQKPGRFEVAEGGTLFLDEIGDLPFELQTKLLRVLQDGEFERLGSSRAIKINTRIIAATSRNLQGEVEAGKFRQELYYRLNVFPIVIPPLRHRGEDKLLFIQHFVRKFARKMGKTIDSIPQSTLDAMLSYRWPGNVRELEHFIERGVILSSNNTFQIDGDFRLPTAEESPAAGVDDLKTLERNHITHVLTLTGWKINGPDGAAALLDIHPSTLRFRMKKLGIKRPEDKPGSPVQVRTAHHYL